MNLLKVSDEVKIVSAVFLDRDGVINQDSGYVGNWADFHFCPGALDALKVLSDKEVDIIIVTNQSGIARGYYTEEDYDILTKKMLETMENHGVAISSVYHCPHHVEGDVLKYAVTCDCRKPKPGMILKGLEAFSIKAENAIMVGDKDSDELASKAANLNFFYINTKIRNQSSDYFGSLSECIEFIANSPKYKLCRNYEILEVGKISL